MPPATHMENHTGVVDSWAQSSIVLAVAHIQTANHHMEDDAGMLTNFHTFLTSIILPLKWMKINIFKLMILEKNYSVLF